MIDRIPEPLVNDPYNNILEFYESKYPHAGEQFFTYAALQVASLIIPKLDYEGTKKRSSLSIMCLANSGAGKSSLLGEVEDLSRQPYYVSKVTPARLEEDLKNKSDLNILINDAKRILNEEDFKKVLESAIGDGRISRKTYDSSSSATDLSVGGIIMGVPSDIKSDISSGLLFRVVPMIISYDSEQQKEIGRNLVDRTGKDNTGDIEKKDIVNYYDSLYDIQSSTTKTPEFPRIGGYKFKDDHRDSIYEAWEEVLEEKNIDQSTNWFRELYDAFRFACSSAFLNYFNRKKVEENGKVKLCIDTEDIVLAANLMKQEMARKLVYLSQQSVQRQINKLEDFEKA